MPNIFTLYSGVMISGIVLFLKLMTLSVYAGFGVKLNGQSHNGIAHFKIYGLKKFEFEEI